MAQQVSIKSFEPARNNGHYTAEIKLPGDITYHTYSITCAHGKIYHLLWIRNGFDALMVCDSNDRIPKKREVGITVSSSDNNADPERVKQGLLSLCDPA